MSKEDGISVQHNGREKTSGCRPVGSELIGVPEVTYPFSELHADLWMFLRYGAEY